MNQMITFFSENAMGQRLIGIGLTDDVIAHLKKDGGILQEAQRNGQNADIALIYSPDIEALTKKIGDLTSSAKDREIKFI